MWGKEGETWNLENNVHVPTQDILDSFSADSNSIRIELPYGD
ncbi:MAG TPA: hypothetical protein VHQ24_16125 [Lachnospiraceae bacterium]|nr:hypothetical protein [Lachnospiraceae bacterium]